MNMGTELTDYHEQFAAVYDTFYADRDVDADTRFAVGLLGLADRSRGSVHVLDFGCGTGAHVLALARMGIEATGFDTSNAMIELAKTKPIQADSASVHLHSGSFTRCATGWHPKASTAW